jgi:uncharacterized damage-inducible protein DinB
MQQATDTTRSFIDTMFSHLDWGRDALLDWAADLPDSDLDRPFEMGQGSLRETFIHLWVVEELWLSRWQGNSPTKPPAYNQSASVDEFRRLFAGVADRRRAFVDSVSGELSTRQVDYKSLAGESNRQILAHLMLHVANHGIYHRAQAMNMLRHLGVKVKNVGFLVQLIKQPDLRPAHSAEWLARYYRYGDWANTRVFDIASGLMDVQLDQPFEIGFGTLRLTMQHIMNAESWWLASWKNEPMPDFPPADPSASLCDIRREFDQVATTRNGILSDGPAAALERNVNITFGGRAGSFRLGDSMLQLCTHGTHHRAQAVNMLRHLGARVPVMDYVSMLPKL